MHSDLPNPSTLREHFDPYDRTLTVNRNIGGLDGAKDASVRQLFSGLPSFGSGRILARSANQDDQMPACLVSTMPPTRHWTAVEAGAATIFAVLDPTLAIAPKGGLFATMVV